MIQINIDHGCVATMGPMDLGNLTVDNHDLEVSRTLNVCATDILSITAEYKGTLPIAAEYKERAADVTVG